MLETVVRGECHLFTAAEIQCLKMYQTLNGTYLLYFSCLRWVI